MLPFLSPVGVRESVSEGWRLFQVTVTGRCGRLLLDLTRLMLLASKVDILASIFRFRTVYPSSFSLFRRRLPAQMGRPHIGSNVYLGIKCQWRCGMEFPNNSKFILSGLSALDSAFA